MTFIVVCIIVGFGVGAIATTLANVLRYRKTQRAMKRVLDGSPRKDWR